MVDALHIKASVSSMIKKEGQLLRILCHSQDQAYLFLTPDSLWVLSHHHFLTGGITRIAIIAGIFWPNLPTSSNPPKPIILQCYTNQSCLLLILLSHIPVLHVYLYMLIAKSVITNCLADAEPLHYNEIFSLLCHGKKKSIVSSLESI